MSKSSGGTRKSTGFRIQQDYGLWYEREIVPLEKLKLNPKLKLIDYPKYISGKWLFSYKGSTRPKSCLNTSAQQFPSETIACNIFRPGHRGACQFQNNSPTTRLKGFYCETRLWVPELKLNVCTCRCFTSFLELE